jgi:hypothetical protein
MATQNIFNKVPIPELKTDVDFIKLYIEVPNIQKLLPLYNVIEVWRSLDNITYNEITAETDTVAVIDSTITGPTWNLNGTQLIIEKNSAPTFTISFTTANPYNLQTILNIINEQAKTHYVNRFSDFATQKPTNTNLIRFKSDIEGLESSLKITGSAASILGIASTKNYGAIHRIHLTRPTTHYEFEDYSAEDLSLTYYYKVRFRSTETDRVSSFSSYILGQPLTIVDGAELVTASITLADENGYPQKDKRIVIEVLTQYTNDDFIGVLQKSIDLKTDQFGFASTKLPKNIDIKVYIEDSFLNRVINTGTSDFNLLDKISAAPDPLNLTTQPNLVPVISIT